MKEVDQIVEIANEKAQKWEIFFVESDEDRISFENNKLKQARKVNNRGVGLRVIEDGKLGFSSSSDLKESERLVNYALDASSVGDEVKFEFAEPDEIKIEKDRFFQKATEDWEVDNLINIGNALVKRATDFEGALKLSLIFREGGESIRLVNSNGFDNRYKKSSFSFAAIGELVRKGDILQLWKSRASIKPFNNFEEIVENLIEDIQFAMKIEKIETGRFPIIFAPDAVAEILQCLEVGISGKSIVKKISPLCDKLNEKIFDERISIYDCGELEFSERSAPFDDEGITKNDYPIVEDGILKNFQLDLKSAQKLNLEPTGNSSRGGWGGGRNFKVYPHIGFNSIKMKGGELSYEDMLSTVKDGLLIKSIPNVFIGNIQNGDFSGTIWSGYKIENGKIKGRVKNSNVSGNIYELLKNNVESLSEKIYCPDSYSSFRVPYVFLNEVNISSA